MLRLFTLVLGLAAGSAGAAEVEIAVVDGDGKPVADAVVSLLSNAGLDTGPGVAQTKTIDQHALQFSPYLELFHPGDQVVFHNSDRTNHHVYSFSPPRPFETMVEPGQTTEPMTLEQPGVIAVGCNIHDRMIAYLVVSDAPFVARTGKDGLARFAAVPDGGWTVRVWQPRLKPANKSVEQPLAVAADAAVKLRVAIGLLPDTRRPADRETATY